MDARCKTGSDKHRMDLKIPSIKMRIVEKMVIGISLEMKIHRMKKAGVILFKRLLNSGRES